LLTIDYGIGPGHAGLGQRDEAGEQRITKLHVNGSSYCGIAFQRDRYRDGSVPTLLGGVVQRIRGLSACVGGEGGAGQRRLGTAFNYPGENKILAGYGSAAIRQCGRHGGGAAHAGAGIFSAESEYILRGAGTCAEHSE
jgi:hypothetical protein